MSYRSFFSSHHLFSTSHRIASAPARTDHERVFPLESGSQAAPTGLPGSGKTTILYYLTLDEVVPTMSSIGFNVETFGIRTSNGKTFKCTGWDLGMGCASSTYMYGMIQAYTATSDAVIWVVDAEDGDYLPESVATLQKIIANIETDNERKVPLERLPILILANKCDKPGALSVDAIRILFSKAVAGKMSAVFQTKCVPESPVSTSGLPEAFDWLSLVLDICNSKAPPAEIKQKAQALSAPDPRSQATIMHKLGVWLGRAEVDIPPEEFIAKFNTFSLPEWDHYTHIRIAYVLLTTYGRKEGKDLIFKGLEAYISTSPQTSGRTFHVTMTYFWIQIVHFGIRNMAPVPTASSTLDKAADSEKMASPHDFARFLLVNPHVADGNLWADYYSKEVLMSPTAKSEMVLPDKNPLPNLVIRDSLKVFNT